MVDASKYIARESEYGKIYYFLARKRWGKAVAYKHIAIMKALLKFFSELNIKKISIDEI